MSGLPMICSAMLNSQLGLVVQSAEAADTQADVKRGSGGAPPPCGAPSPPAPLDLDEWLLSDVIWDPFDLLRHPPARPLLAM